MTDDNSRHSRPLYVLAMLATAAAAGRGEFLCIPDRQILKLQMTKTSQNLLKAHVGTWHPVVQGHGAMRVMRYDHHPTLACTVQISQISI